MSFWGRGIVRISKIKIFVEGQENLPKEKEGMIVLYNHVSYLDIPIINFILPQVRFGAKEELFRIPIFGFALRKSGSFPVARKKAFKVMSLYRKSIQRVQEGESFALAPEGTRQDGSEVKAFKRGPFVFSIEGGLSLLPVVLVGVDKIFPKRSWRIRMEVKRREVKAYVLPRIETKDLKVQDVNELKQKVQEKMAQVYSKNISKFS